MTRPNKMMCSLALIAGTLLAGCMTDPEPQTGQIDDDLNGSCKPRCEKCHPGDVCTELCMYPVHCQTTCDIVATCIINYTWDANACTCVLAK